MEVKYNQMLSTISREQMKGTSTEEAEAQNQTPIFL